MKTTMTIAKEGWNWHVEDIQLLNIIIDCLNNPATCNLIKKNDLREVFHVQTPENGNFYLKHDKPQKLRVQLKSLFQSKVKSEHDSAKQLASRGIPIAEYVGWGSKGTEGLLISHELTHSVNAKEWWFTHCFTDHRNQEAFIASLTTFLKAFLGYSSVRNTVIYHPDFHIGNLLYTPNDKKLHIIDPYGVKIKKCNLKQRFAMYRIIGALRGELSDQQACELILQCNMAANRQDALHLWQQIVTAENEEMKKVWPKRKKQVLSGNSKYCKTVTANDQTYVLRISQGGQLYIKENALNDLHQLKFVDLTPEEAEKKWLESFFLDFQRKKHDMPVAWQKGKGLYMLIST